jgi:ABC-type xylose transport system permease subunit
MGLFDNKSWYTVADLMNYLGLIVGIALTYFALQGFEIHPIIRLIACLIVGVVLGMAFVSAYRRSRRPPPDEKRGHS